jgi:hypothetical protein
LFDRNLLLKGLAIAKNFDSDRGARKLGSCHGRKIARLIDNTAVEFADHVASLQARFVRLTAGRAVNLAKRNYSSFFLAGEGVSPGTFRKSGKQKT